MTAAHPTHRAGSTAPAPRTGADRHDRDRHDEAVRELRRAAATIGAVSAAGPTLPCEGSADCTRPGALTVVDTDDHTGALARLCGLHAMTAVFTAAGTLVVVHPGD